MPEKLKCPYCKSDQIDCLRDEIQIKIYICKTCQKKWYRFSNGAIFIQKNPSLEGIN